MNRGKRYHFATGLKKKLPKQAGKEEFKESREAFSGLKIEELKKLFIPADVMKEGLLFIWAEKELIGQIINHFETQGFEYVENMVYIMLNPDLKTEVDQYRNTDATAAITREGYRFIRKGHKTLLFLRRSAYK